MCGWFRLGPVEQPHEPVKDALPQRAARRLHQRVATVRVRDRAHRPSSLTIGAGGLVTSFANDGPTPPTRADATEVSSDRANPPSANPATFSQSACRALSWSAPMTSRADCAAVLAARSAAACQKARLNMRFYLSELGYLLTVYYTGTRLRT